MKNFLIILLVSVLFLKKGFTQIDTVKTLPNKFFNEKFHTEWVETDFEYHFYDDGIFIIDISGHMGNFYNAGLYSINNDTIYMNSFDSINYIYKGYVYSLCEWDSKFMIDNGKCIYNLDKENDFYKIYCKNEKYFTRRSYSELKLLHSQCKKMIVK